MPIYFVCLAGLDAGEEPQAEGVPDDSDEGTWSIRVLGNEEIEKLKFEHSFLDTASHFPPVTVAFSTDVRAAQLSYLFNQWVELRDQPILCRVNDDGSVDAWFVDDSVAFEPDDDGDHADDWKQGLGPSDDA